METNPFLVWRELHLLLCEQLKQCLAGGSKVQRMRTDIAPSGHFVTASVLPRVLMLTFSRVLVRAPVDGPSFPPIGAIGPHSLR